MAKSDDDKPADGESKAMDIEKELHAMKARTMYKMIEMLPDNQGQLLFLTNSQAELIADGQSSVQRMLEALSGSHDTGAPTAQMFITLLR